MSSTTRPWNASTGSGSIVVTAIQAQAASVSCVSQ